VSRLWPIVRREYLERVRSKTFLVMTILAPALMAAFMVLPSVLMSRQRGKPLRIAVLDATGILRGPVEAALAGRKASGESRFLVEDAGTDAAPETQARLKQRVLDGGLDGYLYLPENVLEASVAEYHGKNVTNLMDLGLMDQAVGEALIRRRLASEGLPAEKLKDVMRRLDIKKLRVSASGEREDRGGSFFLSLTLLMILYTAVAMWGAALMNGVIEEKANRVVEIIVSSVSPTRLFAGKLLGVGAAGLTQSLIWTGVMVGLALLGGGAGPGGLQIPEVPPLVLVLFVVYFLLGYFLYGALYTAVGAAVNSQQEAQSLVFPVMLPLVAGVILFPAVLNSPDSALAITLSLIPFWTPILMFLRVSTLTPPVWQIALSIVLTVATIVVFNWGAARIYRVGVLMYGKRPTFPEILRWVRTP
jgi:ABC-2 type transport system permease protein